MIRPSCARFRTTTRHLIISPLGQPRYNFTAQINNTSSMLCPFSSDDTQTTFRRLTHRVRTILRSYNNTSHTFTFSTFIRYQLKGMFIRNNLFYCTGFSSKNPKCVAKMRESFLEKKWEGKEKSQSTTNLSIRHPSSIVAL